MHLNDTGENVQKWTRVFSTRRWVILVARTRRKKEKKIACSLLDVFACGQVLSPRLYRLTLFDAGSRSFYAKFATKNDFRKVCVIFPSYFEYVWSLSKLVNFWIKSCYLSSSEVDLGITLRVFRLMNHPKVKIFRIGPDQHLDIVSLTKMKFNF